MWWEDSDQNTIIRKCNIQPHSIRSCIILFKMKIQLLYFLFSDYLVQVYTSYKSMYCVCYKKIAICTLECALRCFPLKKNQQSKLINVKIKIVFHLFNIKQNTPFKHYTKLDVVWFDIPLSTRNKYINASNSLYIKK